MPNCADPGGVMKLERFQFFIFWGNDFSQDIDIQKGYIIFLLIPESFSIFPSKDALWAENLRKKRNLMKQIKNYFIFFRKTA
ncbi:MAG: hypothetical protein ACXABX_08835, partial [Candidatus Thorarchaeota archaeon]